MECGVIVECPVFDERRNHVDVVADLTCADKREDVLMDKPSPCIRLSAEMLRESSELRKMRRSYYELTRMSSSLYSRLPIRGRLRATLPRIVCIPINRSQKCPATFAGWSETLWMAYPISSTGSQGAEIGSGIDVRSLSGAPEDTTGCWQRTKISTRSWCVLRRGCCSLVR